MKRAIYFAILFLLIISGCSSNSNNIRVHEKILIGKSQNWECKLLIRYDKSTDQLDEKLIATNKMEITQGPLSIRYEIPNLGSGAELDTDVKTPRKTFSTGGSSSGSLNKFDWAWDYYDKQTDSAVVIIQWIDDQCLKREERIDLK